MLQIFPISGGSCRNIKRNIDISQPKGKEIETLKKSER